MAFLLQPEQRFLFEAQQAANGFDYALGWRVEQRNGVSHVWHTGSCSGYGSIISLIPEKKIAWALLSNTDQSKDALLAMSRALIDEQKDVAVRLPARHSLKSEGWCHAELKETALHRSASTPTSINLPAGEYTNPGLRNY